MTIPSQLTPEALQLVRDIVAGLTGPERQRESARIRHKVLRMDDAYREADNAKKAEAGRESYAADLEASRRKSAAKERQRKARVHGRAGSSAS